MIDSLNELQKTADSFLARHIHEFEPFDWTTEERTEFRRKATTELGMYLYCVEQYRGNRPWIRSHLAERVTDSRFRELLRRYPGRLTQNGFPAIPFYLTGDLPDATERAVEETVRSPRLWARERPPSEMVDLLVQCRLLGHVRRDPDLQSVLEVSNLAQPPDLIGAEIGDFYDLTHVVFLPTGWGTGHSNLLEAPLPYDLESTFTGLLLRAIAMENADAAMELLISGSLQRQLQAPLVERAVRWIHEKMTTQTHVIGPVLFNAAKLPDEWDSGTRTWAKHYHANIQAGIMAEVLAERVGASGGHTDSGRISSAGFRDAIALGRVLNQLHSYRLASAAETLAAIDDETFRWFPTITERIASFIENQQFGDTFGYWVDERRLYELQTGSAAQFEAELVSPIAEKCRNALAQMPSTRPGQR